METSQTLRFDKYPALVLNADHQPLCYHPLSIKPFDWVVKQVWEENVDVLATYDREVRSPSFTWMIPSVVALKRMVPISTHVPRTRFNVFLRDEFRCQYCGDKFAVKELTFDHVIPRARGGKTTWENIVAACHDCNRQKDCRTPKEARMPLLHGLPKKPTMWELRDRQKKFPPKYLHQTWNDFLYWDAELDE